MILTKQVFPGVRLSVSERGVGVSAGTRFLQVSEDATSVLLHGAPPVPLAPG